MNPPSIFALAIDRATPTILYAATDRGVYKSINAAPSWYLFNSDLSNIGALAMVSAPGTPTTLYAGTFGGGVFDIQNVVYRMYLPVAQRGK